MNEIKWPTGKDCKKIECSRYGNYVKWDCGDPNLKYCIKCKWAYPSNFERKQVKHDLPKANK